MGGIPCKDCVQERRRADPSVQTLYSPTEMAAKRGSLETNMAEQGENSSNLVKAFIPGLILGLIVGMAVGAFVTPLLDRSVDTPKPIPGAKRSTAEERDAQPTTPAPAAKPAATSTPAPVPAATPANPQPTPPAGEKPEQPTPTPAAPSPKP